MRKWGIVISSFYIFVLLVFILPFAKGISLNSWSSRSGDWKWYSSVWSDLQWSSSDWEIAAFLLLWCLVLVAGQALLLFLSVDTSFRRLQPRRHILLSIAWISLMVAMLSAFAVGAVDVAINRNSQLWITPIAFLPFWLIWGIIFYKYKAGASDRLNHMTCWLIKGSILELLIVVPCHIIVRQRGDCCAPAVTGLGIATGIAIMLLAFGPSVLFLYQKRLAEYRRPNSGGG
jgi:hypothetical protein